MFLYIMPMEVIQSVLQPRQTKPQSVFILNAFPVNAMYQALQVITKGLVLNVITVAKESLICKSPLLRKVIGIMYSSLLKILTGHISQINMAGFWKTNWKAIKTKLEINWVKSHVIIMHLVWLIQHVSRAIKTKLGKNWVWSQQMYQPNAPLIRISIVFMYSGAIKTNLGQNWVTCLIKVPIQIFT